MHVSLITSLYLTEAHLQTYLEYASKVAKEVLASGITLEYIVVANEATEREKRLLDQFLRSGAVVRILHVPRESLYASWNRGVQAASGEAVGFWNVDDIRTSEGIIEGYRKISQGCKLVYFAHTVIRSGGKQRTYPAVSYDAGLHRRVMKCGPFFMFSPSLYQKVGAFDERFRIVGDWEWCIRATYHADFCPLDLSAGYFLLHGDNLSSTGNPLQVAEENMIALLHENYDRLIPVDPDIMRQTWEKWQLPLPQEIEMQLWGEGAKERLLEWEKYKRTTQYRTRLQLALRYLPKQIIDHTGLRPYLAKLGIVKNR